MKRTAIEATGLTKIFNRRKIFADVTFQLGAGEALAITGRNGSGKSTLVKILSGVLSPTRGEVVLRGSGGEAVAHIDRYRHIGLVSPYLQLYDEFTGWENLDMVRKVRGIAATDALLRSLLERVNLDDRRDDLVRTYSSGMKQRLKYAFALVHEPPILILDEPTSNLDREGIRVVYAIMQEQKSEGILLVATNDVEDLAYCDRVIDLNTGEAKTGRAGG
jgi:heme exporter protein A